MVIHYDGQKMIDVLVDLARKIKKKYQEGIETGSIQNKMRCLILTW